MLNEDLNSIKVMPTEKKRSNKWPEGQLGKESDAVSKWCTNTSQPSRETLIEIAKVFEFDARELIVPTDVQQIMMKSFKHVSTKPCYK